MLPFPVFAKRIPRSPAVPFLSRMPVPQPLSPKFHGISIFADSHPLTRVASIFYRNMAGALLHPRAPRRLAEQGPRFFNVQTVKLSNVTTLQRTSDLSPLFSNSCALISATGVSQLFPCQSLPHSFQLDEGCTPHSLDRASPSPIPFLFFLHSLKTQPFYFQSVPHSLPKTRRWGGASC